MSHQVAGLLQAVSNTYIAKRSTLNRLRRRTLSQLRDRGADTGGCLLSGGRLQSDAAVVRRTVGAPSFVLVFPPFDLVLYKLTELYKLAELIDAAATVRSYERP